MVICVGIQYGAYYLATLFGVQMSEADDDHPIIQTGKALCAGFDKAFAFNNRSLIHIGLSVPFFPAIIGVLL